MPTMNSRTYYGGLGYAVSSDVFADSTMVKSVGRVSLFETESPSGTNYVVVLNYGEPDAEVLFPTPENPSKSGNQRVTKSASEAFEKFDELVIVYGGVSSDASGELKSGSFEELDMYLLSMATMPEDVIVELQRQGIADTGRPKASLDLKFASGLLSSIVGKPKEGMRLARLYYESYPVATRLAALKDMRPSVLQNYLSGNLISSLIMTQKEKRKKYNEELSAGRYATVSMADALNSMSVIGNSPVVAVEVQFIDQKGNEVKGLPYDLSCRGSINFVEAAKATKFGASPGDFSSGRTLSEAGMSGMQEERSDTMPGSLVEGWGGRSLSPDKPYHLLYKYRADGNEGLPRGTLKTHCVNTEASELQT